MHRFQLENTIFEGKNNAYLLEPDGTDEAVLVDTGVALPETRTQLESGLAEHDRSFADVDAVVLTHWHYDHSGLAGTLAREHGATVYAHEIDAPLIRQTDAATEALERRHQELFEQWALPPAKRRRITKFLSDVYEMGDPPATVETVRDGNRLAFGDLELEVIHTPGHAAGHVCYAEVDGDAAYVGDVLLPKYTPNVGGSDVRVERPLGTYCDSLERLRGRELDVAYPGHRRIIDAPDERAREIEAHHQERLERILGVLRDRAPVSVWDVSVELFGDLEGVHIRNGPGEVHAHVIHLEDDGIVARTDDGIDLLDEDAVLPDGAPRADT